MSEQKHDDVSPEETLASEILSQTNLEMKGIDDQLIGAYSDEGPQLELRTPDWLGRKRPFLTKEQRIYYLEQQKQSLKKSAIEKVEGLVEKSDAEIKQKVLMQLDEWENPKLYEKPLEDRRKEEKDISDSQHVALELKESWGKRFLESLEYEEGKDDKDSPEPDKDID